MSFIRGGESEAAGVNLMDVLPFSYKQASTKGQQEGFAQAYEEKYGVIVRRPWENEDEFAKRRGGFKGKPAAKVGARGMDPGLAQKELDRLLRSIDMENPDRKLVGQVHEMEDLLGLHRTNFADPKPSVEVAADLEAKILKFQDKKTTAEKKRIIGLTKDLLFLRAISQLEGEHEDVVQLAIERAGELEIVGT